MDRDGYQSVLDAAVRDMQAWFGNHVSYFRDRPIYLDTERPLAHLAAIGSPSDDPRVEAGRALQTILLFEMLEGSEVVATGFVQFGKAGIMVNTFGVADSYQRRGVGRAFMTWMLMGLPLTFIGMIKFGVENTNLGMIKFLAKFDAVKAMAYQGGDAEDAEAHQASFWDVSIPTACAKLGIRAPYGEGLHFPREVNRFSFRIRYCGRHPQRLITGDPLPIVDR